MSVCLYVCSNTESNDRESVVSYSNAKSEDAQNVGLNSDTESKDGQSVLRSHSNTERTRGCAQ